jgi:hypothetical protein
VVALTDETAKMTASKIYVAQLFFFELIFIYSKIL